MTQHTDTARRLAEALRKLDDAYCSDPPRSRDDRHACRMLLIEVREALAEYDSARSEAAQAGEGEGVALIAAERARQIMQEGWTPEHDDEHVDGEMAVAAAVYAAPAGIRGLVRGYWPWDESWWKPDCDRVRELVKAGALIAAEIDRLKRKAGTATPPAQPATPCGCKGIPLIHILGAEGCLKSAALLPMPSHAPGDSEADEEAPDWKRGQWVEERAGDYGRER